ncbi:MULTISPECIES: hypothetical protein [unclassified Chelatococcus]|uniref:hypothetical protein n=1 Tax=unclassified Chelatococcus TaxID=2638111 RepID=UPI0012E16B4A|nr:MULTISPECIES: hypothetical protein [unclassified Chelatococcus]
MVTIFHAGLWPGIAASCICMAELAEGATRRRTGRPHSAARELFQPRPVVATVSEAGRRARPPADSGYHC